MKPFQFTWFLNSTGVGQQTNFIAHVFHIIGNPLCLLGRDQATLQFLVMGGDAGGAGVFITLQSLYTTPKRT